MAGHPVRTAHAGGGAHGLGKDPGRVPVGHRPAGHLGAGHPRRPAPRPLRLAAQGSGGGHRTQPPVAAHRAPAGGGAPGTPGARYRGVDPDRRHAGGGPPPVRPASPRHPHHDAGVAVPAADLAGPGGAAVGGDRDRRRDPCGGRDQAWGPPRGVVGAPRGAPLRGGPADRALGHRPSGGRGGAVPGRNGAGRDRGEPAGREAVGALCRGPPGGHERSRRRSGAVRSAPTVQRSCSRTPGGWRSACAPA